MLNEIVRPSKYLSLVKSYCDLMTFYKLSFKKILQKYSVFSTIMLKILQYTV